MGSAGFFEHQRLAFDRILAGKSILLTAGTSSGKTYAAALPLLQRLATGATRRACFVYPTRALLEGQRIDVGQLAALRDLTVGVATGGKHVSHLLDAMASRVVFATPDELYWYFAKTVKHAGALAWSLTQIDDYVFDEIHVFRHYALDNLVWFLKRLQALNPRARFHFLSATTAPELATRLAAFGDYSEPIRGESYTGPIDVTFTTWHPLTWRHRQSVLDYLMAENNRHTVAIFNSARFVHRFSLAYSELRDGSHYLRGSNVRCFRYTGYMEKSARDLVIADFQGSGGVLLTTSAAEVGVDFDCDRELLEEFGPESTVQRFGRAGRGGRPAQVTIAAKEGLETQIRNRLRADEVSRDEFVSALSEVLGGYQDSIKTSQFAAYTHYCVNLRLGSTGQTLNEALFSPGERDQFRSWQAGANPVRYGLRSVLPQTRLANGVSADPFYILQLAPGGSLRTPDDSRFIIVDVDRSYDSLVWQPFAFGVSVDEAATFARSKLVDTAYGLAALCEKPTPDQLHALSPIGASRFIRRPEGPIARIDGVRLALCFGDIVLQRTSLAGGVVSGDPVLAIPDWYYLLLASGDSVALGRLVWRLLDADPEDGSADAGQSPVSGEGFPSPLNRGALADLVPVPATSDPQYMFVLETAYGACYEVWRELSEQSNH